MGTMRALALQRVGVIRPANEILEGTIDLTEDYEDEEIEGPVEVLNDEPAVESNLEVVPAAKGRLGDVPAVESVSNQEMTMESSMVTPTDMAVEMAPMAMTTP